MLHRARRGGPSRAWAQDTRRGRRETRWGRRETRWVLAAALAVPVTLGAGCGGPAHPPTGGAPTALAVAASPPAGSAAGPRLPLDPYLLSPPESVRVARAYRVLLDECVRRFGLPIPPDRADAGALPPDLNSRRYGITDARLAAVAGYRVSAPPASPQTASPQSTRPQSRPPSPRPPGGTVDPGGAVRSGGSDDPRRSADRGDAADPNTLTVLDGARDAVVNGQRVPAGGCVGEAKRRLSAGAPAVADPNVAQRLSQESYFASGRDPRVRAVIGAWSACMRGRGYEYASPLAAAADPRFVRGPVSATETAVAAVDIACKERTGLVGAWSAVEAELERPVVAAHQRVLDDIARLNQTQLRVARDLGLG